MLLQFSVENHLCFAEEQSLSLVASKDEQHFNHLISIRENYKHQLLRIAALYGANAHGKTKLVESMAFAQKLIVHGKKRGQEIAVNPFRLNPQLSQSPSRFEFVFFHENIEYSYGFVVNRQKILEEWLFARPHAREIRYFERKTLENGQSEVEFGTILLKNTEKKFLTFIVQGMQENQLFLTEAFERNVDILKPVYEWFNNSLVIIIPNELLNLEEWFKKQETLTPFVLDFLQFANIGIKEILVEKNEHLSESLYYLKTQHQDSNNELITFELDEESSGTQRLIELLPIFAELENSNKIYVIDELDRKLHPFLSKLFVQYFLQKSQKTNSQFIFTTHETHLLDQDFLRRDEIWFIEKDRLGCSHLYSLADFKIHPDIKIEKGYLQGRFGAIPFVGNINLLDN